MKIILRKFVQVITKEGGNMSLQIIDSIVSIQVEQQVKEIITVLKPMLEDIISGVTLEYMDYQQASEYLGVSVGTIRKYVSQYGLPVIKIDTVIRFKKSDIDSFMEQYKVE